MAGPTSWVVLVLCSLLAMLQPVTASWPLHAPFELASCNSSSDLQRFVLTRVDDISYVALVGSDSLCLDAACPNMKNCAGATPHTAKCSKHKNNPNQKWMISSGQMPLTSQIAHLAIEQTAVVCLVPNKKQSITSLSACAKDTNWIFTPATSGEADELSIQWAAKPHLCLALSSSSPHPGPSPPSDTVLTCHDPKLASLPFCNQTLSPKMRVADLLPRMKLADKIAMLHGGNSLPDQRRKVYSGETARNAGVVQLYLFVLPSSINDLNHNKLHMDLSDHSDHNRSINARLTFAINLFRSWDPPSQTERWSPRIPNAQLEQRRDVHAVVSEWGCVRGWIYRGDMHAHHT